MADDTLSQPLWMPSCDLAMLRLRSATLTTVREFFVEREYLEVETPVLSRDVVVDAHLQPFELPREDDQPSFFLQTSPEAGMKRLLAAGSGSIFQITRSFRKGEQGARHNPEFSMVEWYGVGSTYHEQMQRTEDLIRRCADVVKQFVERQAATDAAVGSNTTPTVLSDRPFTRSAYDSVFPFAESGVLDLTVSQLQSLVTEHTAVADTEKLIHDRDDLLNVLLAEYVEPKLGISHPEFVYNYPYSQAALAETNPEDLRTACRFELYINGLEICNGYQELTDPAELSRRDAAQNSSRVDHASAPLPGARLMMSAMQSGLPSCSGVALGFDRLLMAMTGAPSIADVMPFPTDRA